MAWRIEHLVIDGELDNTRPGWTIGWIQLEGVPHRLQLKLAGNCHPDLAGWKFRIKRREPSPAKDFDGEEPPDYTRIHPDQSGHIGAVTADQTIKHVDVSTVEMLGRLRGGEVVPFTWRKCLYLEWFSNHNGRVVIQSDCLEVERMGTRAFELTEDQWQAQRRDNEAEMQFFMTQLCDALENIDLDEGDA